MSDRHAALSPTTEHIGPPSLHIAAAVPVGSMRLSQISALTHTVRELQGALATWEPLRAAYDAEMARRLAAGFKVEGLETWVRDLAQRMGGISAEDGGAVSDRHNEYARDGD